LSFWFDPVSERPVIWTVLWKPTLEKFGIPGLDVIDRIDKMVGYLEPNGNKGRLRNLG
jgi:hypothetical protein